MSDGSRSGVHCTRRNVSPSAVARLRAASVLPRPGHVLEQHVPAGRAPPRARPSAGSRMPTTSVATSSRIAPPALGDLRDGQGVGCSVMWSPGSVVVVVRDLGPRRVEHVDGVPDVGRSSGSGERGAGERAERAAADERRIARVVGRVRQVEPVAREPASRRPRARRRSTRSPTRPSRPTIAHARSCTSPRAPCRRSSRVRSEPGSGRAVEPREHEDARAATSSPDAAPTVHVRAGRPAQAASRPRRRSPTYGPPVPHASAPAVRGRPRSPRGCVRAPRRRPCRREPVLAVPRGEVEVEQRCASRAGRRAWRRAPRP